jgi:hypothetical protein
MKGLRERIRLAKDDRAQLFIVHVVNELYRLRQPGRLDRRRGHRAGACEKAWRRVRGQGKGGCRQGTASRAKTLMREDTLGGAAADLIVREARKSAPTWSCSAHTAGGTAARGARQRREQVVRRSPVPVLLVRAAELI